MTRAASARARRLARLDLAHSWKPFTPMTEYARHGPLVIERGKGPWLWDVDGRRYLDGVSSLWVNVHGHRAREIDGAIRRQLGRVAHTTLLGPTHPGAIELAGELVRIAPKGLTRVFFSDSGSAAVEVALKMAFQYWRQRRRAEPRRTRFVAFEGAYHGDTLGAVSVGGMDLFHRIFHPLLFRTLRAPAGDAKALAALLRRHGRTVAAVVLEPRVHGAAGILVQPPGFVREVRRLCDLHGTLLIADEVATGFGRTGAMFACQKEGVRPDLMAVAKSITGGYLPLSATLATEEIYRAFLGRPEESRTFFHGHSYAGNPLACAAALANLRLYRTRRIVPKVRAAARQLARELAPLASHPNVLEIRQEGLMAGIELVRDRGGPARFDPAERAGARVCRAALAHGLLIRPLGDVVVLMPPLAIQGPEIRWIVSSLRAAMRDVLGT